MRTRTRGTLAGAGLATVAAVLLAGCGDSGSAKGSATPAREKPKAEQPLPESPPVKSLEPIAPPPAPEPEKPKESTLPKDPLPPPAPPPAPAEEKTPPKPATEKSLETTSYKCDACGKVATVAKTETAPTCCGSAMKPQP
jgi:outer membrane biosynthesis protein TonB